MIKSNAHLITVCIPLTCGLSGRMRTDSGNLFPFGCSFRSLVRDLNPRYTPLKRCQSLSLSTSSTQSAFTFFSWFLMCWTISLIATSFSAPWGTTMSAYCMVGSMYCWKACQGEGKSTYICTQLHSEVHSQVWQICCTAWEHPPTLYPSQWCLSSICTSNHAQPSHALKLNAYRGCTS